MTLSGARRRRSLQFPWIATIPLICFFLFRTIELFLVAHDPSLFTNIDIDVPVPSLKTNSSITIDTEERGKRLFTNQDDNYDEESFSACILWSDDNFRLEEWLAYHYYIMKLRYVVIAVDHWSKTSVDEIVNRWNDPDNKYNLGMTIKIWNDEDYISDFQEWMDILQNVKENSKEPLDYQRNRTKYHRMKQPQFYKHCSKHLIERNKTWTSYHDTDEFITFKSKIKRIEKKKRNLPSTDISVSSSKKMEEAGYILRRLNEIKKKASPRTHANIQGVSCVTVGRKRYCPKELTIDETIKLFAPAGNQTVVDGIIPEGFMRKNSQTYTDKDRQAIVRRFDTLRFQYSTGGHDGTQKSFIDLSQMHPQLYVRNAEPWHEDNIFKAHWVMQKLCVNETRDRLPELKALIQEENFQINHYMGSFESYSFRDDARAGSEKTYEKWLAKSKASGEYSHVIRPWLKGFVNLVGGPDVASYLLQDAGKFPEDYNVDAKIQQYRASLPNENQMAEKNATIGRT